MVLNCYLILSLNTFYVLNKNLAFPFLVQKKNKNKKISPHLQREKKTKNKRKTNKQKSPLPLYLTLANTHILLSLLLSFWNPAILINISFMKGVRLCNILAYKGQTQTVLSWPPWWVWTQRDRLKKPEMEAWLHFPKQCGTPCRALSISLRSLPLVTNGINCESQTLSKLINTINIATRCCCPLEVWRLCI